MYSKYYHSMCSFVRICAQGTEEVLYIMFESPCESKAVEQSTASLEIEASETVRNK